MKYIASCSFGKDSLATVLMLIERDLPLDEVVFYDTGMEFQAIYDLRDAMLPIFQRHGIKYTTLYPDNPFLYDMLERPVKGRERRGYEELAVVLCFSNSHAMSYERTLAFLKAPFERRKPNHETL